MASAVDSRIAIVTGAGRGIGAAIAERLAEDGCIVACIDVDLERATVVAESIMRRGHSAAGFGADITRAEEVERAVSAINGQFGAPTILVNNAGIVRDALLFKMSEDDWDSVINVHLRGAFLMSKAVQAHMVAENHGRIVNISSTSALGNRGQSNYSTAKAGIQGFTKTLAIELGRYGITANVVAPGFIVSEMTESVAARLGISFGELVASRAATIPVGRVGTPGDVAAAVAFFCSGEAGFISGQVLYVAGGPKI